MTTLKNLHIGVSLSKEKERKHLLNIFKYFPYLEKLTLWVRALTSEFRSFPMDSESPDSLVKTEYKKHPSCVHFSTTAFFPSFLDC